MTTRTVWRKSGLRILRMHRIHGLGFHRFAQIGRNAFRRDHFQGFHQDWPAPGKVPSEASGPRGTTDIAGRRGRCSSQERRRNLFVKNTSQARLSTARHEKEFASLRDFSARVGGDPLLVQASNGNTSIKLDGILWIKASGKWLAHAMQEEMFVPLKLAEVEQSIRNDMEVAARYIPNDGLRPSIETAMHAVLRHHVVLHVHSVNAIAWAIRLDGPDRLTERLSGLHWQWIPYAASGIPPAREIEKVVTCRPETDVLILGNHGLVVGGPDCRTAEKLLCEVERRLAIYPPRFPKPDTTVLAMIARFSRWQFPDVELLHALGTDESSRKILRAGVLYPCQAIFLCPTMPLLPPPAVISKFT